MTRPDFHTSQSNAEAPGGVEPDGVRLRGPCVLLPGYLHGLRQQALIAEVEIFDRGIDLVMLDRGIAELTADFQFEYSPPSVSGAGSVAARIAHLAVGLQRHFGLPVSRSFRIGATNPEETIYRVAIPCQNFEIADKLVAWLVQAANLSVSASHDRLRVVGSRESLGRLGKELKRYAPEALDAYNLIEAAWTLDVPVSRVVGNIFRFGTGCRARLLDSTFTDQTSAIGASIARNKLATAAVLRQGGLPTPDQHPVLDADSAVKAAGSLGYPVVIKPVAEDGGRGVFADLKNDDAVRSAFNEACVYSRDILVERHFRGQDYRIAVHEGVVIKIEQRVAGGVIGDGRSSVAELVAALQTTPRHQRHHRSTGKTLIAIDSEATGLLRDQELEATSVPALGRVVRLRRKNNISTGGEQIAVLIDDAHPDNLALARRAAELLQLDLAGVDLLIPDISVSWLESGAIICEVNAKPQIGAFTTPRIYVELLHKLVGEDARIPVHMLLTRDEDVRQAGLDTLMEEFSCNALSTPGGVWIDGQRLAGRFASGFAAARALSRERAARSALCVLPMTELERYGLPVDCLNSLRLADGCPPLGALAAAISPHLAANRTKRDA